MKIALITDGIWPYVLGGMQKHSYYLCKYLAQNKVYVDLVHYNNSNYDINKLEFFSDEEKQFINPIIVDFPKGNKLPGHYIRSSYLHSKLIFEAIKDKLSTYDFIYTKGFTGWYLIDQKKEGKIKCAKIGVKFHGYEMFQKAPDFKTKLQHELLLRKPVREICQKADVVFSYGGKITQIIRSIGVISYKIFELPSGVESALVADKIVPTGEKMKLIFVGRYERRKGIEELNTVLQNTRNKNFEFHFVGPIPEEKKIKRDNIIYHGEIRDRAEITKIIRSCDVLLCPSWSEGMPNVILEAMANGLAVAATNVGATGVLVNDKNGWLIDDSTSDDIANTFRDIMSVDANKIDYKKQHALNHIKEGFIWENLIVTLLNKIKN